MILNRDYINIAMMNIMFFFLLSGISARNTQTAAEKNGKSDSGVGVCSCIGN